MIIDMFDHRSGIEFSFCAVSPGQVFLVFHSETKRALLPNEVTSIDTVRALFVRSFPRSLSMRFFESPLHKIYILDQTTNIFYELDDLRYFLAAVKGQFSPDFNFLSNSVFRTMQHIIDKIKMLMWQFLTKSFAQ